MLQVYLFGSRASGANKPGADIDVAVDTGSTILLREMDRARVTLDHLFIALKIDLVDINAIPDDLKQVILSQGIKWTN